jgi:hypothetical protein
MAIVFNGVGEVALFAHEFHASEARHNRIRMRTTPRYPDGQMDSR